jgi:uncharacterized protein with NRDE domain
MCLLVFAWQPEADALLVFAGNRDERHARAAAPAGFWQDAPRVLAGRDLEAGGTWLGVTPTGRFAVVTNYREGLNPPRAQRSRGELPAEFLKGGMPPRDYLHELRGRAQEYGGFSLVFGDRTGLYYLSNRDPRSGAIAPGIHGMSNHLLDTPWPKVQRSKQRLALLLEQDTIAGESLFQLLHDRDAAEDAELPDTGIGQELERQVSAPFVINPVYGTRCSTTLCLRADGGLRFAERRFDPAGERIETRAFQMTGTAV